MAQGPRRLACSPLSLHRPRSLSLRESSRVDQDHECECKFSAAWPRSRGPREAAGVAGTRGGRPWVWTGWVRPWGGGEGALRPGLVEIRAGRLSPYLSPAASFPGCPPLPPVGAPGGGGGEVLAQSQSPECLLWVCVYSTWCIHVRASRVRKGRSCEHMCACTPCVLASLGTHMCVRECDRTEPCFGFARVTLMGVCARVRVCVLRVLSRELRCVLVFRTCTPACACACGCRRGGGIGGPVWLG